MKLKQLLIYYLLHKSYQNYVGKYYIFKVIYAQIAANASTLLFPSKNVFDKFYIKVNVQC